MNEIGSEPVPEGELQDTKDFLIGSFPLQIETPQQVASQVTSIRLLGLPPESLFDFRERVAALDADAVRAAARSNIRTQDVLIVAAGDATQLREQLSTLGHVRIEDVEGRPMSLADLAPQGPSLTLDASGLQPDTFTYQILAGGNEVARTTRSLTRQDDGLIRFGSEIAGPQRVTQEVVFDEAFGLVSSRHEISAAGQSVTVEARVEDGRIVGAIELPGGTQEIEMAAPEGIMVGDMVELALRVAPLEEGLEMSFPLAVLQTESVENVTLTVAERAEVTVPAGTFDAFRVEMAGPEAQTFWVEAAAPHRVLRIQVAGQPLSVELMGEDGG
jgi:hypothetical protein